MGELQFNLNNATRDEVFSYLLKADDAYFNDEEIISDSQYDAIKLIAFTHYPNDAYFKKVGSAVRGEEVAHSFPTGGLNQLYTGGVARWLLTHHSEHYIVSEKLDGSSATLSFVGGQLRVALTRGDGLVGKDATRHFLQMSCVPKTLSIPYSDFVVPASLEVRGEFIIAKHNFEIVKKLLKEANGREYKNLRSIANGLINAKVIPESVIPYIDFVAYDCPGYKANKIEIFEMLRLLGFKIPELYFTTVENITEEKLTSNLNFWRDYGKYEIDGVVTELNDADEREALAVSEDDLIPDFAFKWKVGAESNSADTTCIGVEWNISKDKYLKPTILFEPVELCGATIQRTSGFNASFIFEKGIGKGAQITITRAGDVIPYITGITLAVEPDMPQTEWEWNETEVDAIAIEDTEESILTRLHFFFSKLKIDALGDKSIKKLYDAGFKSVEDIIGASSDQLVEVLGKNGNKAFLSLSKTLKRIPIHQLMGACTFFGRGFGTRKSLALIKAFPDWKTVSMSQLISIEGFQDKTAFAFLKGRLQFDTFCKWLLDVEAVEEFTYPEVIEKNLDGRFNNFSFCFTGVRSKPHEELIKAQGGEIHDGVKKDTTHLVVKDETFTSNKVTKARERGIIVLSLHQLDILIAG